MTQPVQQQEHSPPATGVHHLREAAAIEAVGLGHPEVDAEHLLLGPVVVGGPSARALAAGGADLPAHGLLRAA